MEESSFLPCCGGPQGPAEEDRNQLFDLAYFSQEVNLMLRNYISPNEC